MTKKTISRFALVACLSACSTANPIQDAIEFGYVVDGDEAHEIVQVFELKGDTVIQLRNFEESAPVFMGALGAITYSRVGQSAVVKGIHTTLSLDSSWGKIAIRRNTVPKPVLPKPALAIGTAGSPDSEEFKATRRLKAEIAAMRTELTRLKGQLASDRIVPSVPISASETALAERFAPISAEIKITSYSVNFKNNSVSFSPNRQTKSLFLAKAKGASRVLITGYTDSVQANAASSRLAKGRAASTQAFLIQGGISPEKIQLSYRPAGGFIADNSTLEGKLANRRVEVQFI